MFITSTKLQYKPKSFFHCTLPLGKIRRKSFVVNHLTLRTRTCVSEVSVEKFRNSMVIYEIYETFPFRNFLRIRYDSMADQTKILKEGKILDLSYNAIIFKPGVHQPQTGIHLVSKNCFCADVCMCVCVSE